MKAWFTTFAVILALVQLYTSLRIYGKASLPPRELPVWFGALHRLSGIAAFLFTLPVAYHCLWSLGFDPTGNTRVFFHSVFGLFFYGAFAAKVVIVRSRRMPGWALPAVGGAVFTVLVLVWLTSSLWYYDTVGFPEF